MRLFIAINFNNDTRLRLLVLRGKSEYGNLSASKNLHLRLAFLGECNGKQIATAKSALSAVSPEPFGVSVGRVGVRVYSKSVANLRFLLQLSPTPIP
jgi:2'-5' RNA ligase